MQRVFIIIGIVCLAIALLWPLLRRLGLGKLPGDLSFEWNGMKIYFPITTMIIISVILTALFYFLRR